MLSRAKRQDLFKRCLSLVTSVHHTDLMFVFFANKVRIIRQSGRGHASFRKQKTMDGRDAPTAWLKNGEAQLNVALYCVNDVRLQKNVHTQILQSGKVSWITRSGKKMDWLAAKEMNHAIRIHKALSKAKSSKRKRDASLADIYDKDLSSFGAFYYDSFEDFLSVKCSSCRPNQIQSG